jgi:hypothetical protein
MLILGTLPGSLSRLRDRKRSNYGNKRCFGKMQMADGLCRRARQKAAWEQSRGREVPWPIEFGACTDRLKELAALDAAEQGTRP